MLYTFILQQHSVTALVVGRACGGFEGALVERIVLLVLVVMDVLVEG